MYLKKINMKLYYYYLFRIYLFFRDVKKERSNFTISTSIVSSFFISFNLFSIIDFMEYYDFISMNFISNGFYVIPIMIFIWYFNYILFVKDEIFLKMNFNNDIKGGIIVILYMIFTILFSIYIGKMKRDKLSLTYKESFELVSYKAQIPSNPLCVVHKKQII